MGQVTIYLDDETEKRMVKAAKSLDISKSKWISRLIDAKLTTEWPVSVVELAGDWRDAPEAKALRTELGRDIKRGQI